MASGAFDYCRNCLYWGSVIIDGAAECSSKKIPTMEKQWCFDHKRKDESNLSDPAVRLDKQIEDAIFFHSLYKIK